MPGPLEHLGSCWWWLVLLGLATGFLSGTFGVGGGILAVPALVILFAVPQKSAQATSLVIILPTALLGIYLYSRHPEIKINFLAAGIIALAALAGTAIGTQVVHRVPADWLRRAFAILLVIAAVQMFFKKSPQNTPAIADTNPLPAAGQPDKGK